MTVVAVVVVYFGFAAVRFLLRPRHFSWPAPGRTWLAALGWMLLVLYLAIAWSASGRSVGKQAMGLRVVDRHGDRLSFPMALLRALFCAAFPIGLFWSAVSRENRSVQDLVLRTSVIYDWQARILPEPRSLSSP